MKRFFWTIPIALTCACLVPPAPLGAAQDRSSGSDRHALRLMSELSAAFRGTSRLVRMDLTTSYFGDRWAASGSPTLRRTLWAVVDGDSSKTRLLYVFTDPARVAGTMLLIHDEVDPAKPDSTWLYLRSRGRFRALDVRAHRLLIPGTALSYEDSRGFLSIEAYDFAVAAGDAHAHEPSSVSVLAYPKGRSIAEQLGYGRLVVLVDTTKTLIRRIEYQDPGLRALKTYMLVKERALGDLWLPGEVVVRHHAESLETRVVYEYWPLGSLEPPASVRPEVSSIRTFLERLRNAPEETAVTQALQDILSAVGDPSGGR